MAKTFSKALLLTVATLSFGGCTKLDNAIASVPFLAMMRNAPSFDPYEAPLPAPPGAIPFDGPQGLGVHLQPLEASDVAISAFAASPAGRSPFAANDTAALALGQKMFERHCAVCHGRGGLGDGTVVGAGRFPMQPPSLVTGGRPAGYIYGIIRAGRGLMPSYGARTTDRERWSIATYVLSLENGGGAAVPAVTAPADSATPAGQENR